MEFAEQVPEPLRGMRDRRPGPVHRAPARRTGMSRAAARADESESERQHDRTTDDTAGHCTNLDADQLDGVGQRGCRDEIAVRTRHTSWMGSSPLHRAASAGPPLVCARDRAGHSPSRSVVRAAGPPSRPVVSMASSIPEAYRTEAASRGWRSCSSWAPRGKAYVKAAIDGCSIALQGRQPRIGVARLEPRHCRLRRLHASGDLGLGKAKQ